MPEKEKLFDICMEHDLLVDIDIEDPGSILEALNSCIDMVRDAIDFSVNDDRAEIAEDSECFTSVDRVGDKLIASWGFEWSVYSGCKDQCYCDHSEGSTEIKVSNGNIYLGSHVYLERPSTFEEF